MLSIKFLLGAGAPENHTRPCEINQPKLKKTCSARVLWFSKRQSVFNEMSALPFQRARDRKGKSRTPK